MAKFRLRAVFALVAGILITIGGCADNSPTANTNPQDMRYERIRLLNPTAQGSQNRVNRPFAEKVIGPAGGTLDIPGGHALSFPAGALTSPTRIQAKVDTRYVEVEFSPHGLKFPAGREPVLTLSHAEAQVLPTSQLSIIYVDEEGKFLEFVGGTPDRGSERVAVKLRHFSAYAMVSSQ